LTKFPHEYKTYVKDQTAFTEKLKTHTIELDLKLGNLEFLLNEMGDLAEISN